MFYTPTFFFITLNRCHYGTTLFNSMIQLTYTRIHTKGTKKKKKGKNQLAILRLSSGLSQRVGAIIFTYMIARMHVYGITNTCFTRKFNYRMTHKKNKNIQRPRTLLLISSNLFARLIIELIDRRSLSMNIFLWVQHLINLIDGGRYSNLPGNK